MQTIQFLATEGGSSTQRAVAPVVHQASLTMAVASGAAKQDLLEAIAAGECAAFGGQVVNRGCYDVLATISYLEGSDCNSCTQDLLETVEVEVTIPANSVFPLPQGYHQQIEVQTLDSAGAPIANTTEVSLKFFSSYQPQCNGCEKAV
jgi:hypothetical protein